MTDKADWPAELVALAYRYRCVALFFRWLKAVLDYRYLLSESAGGRCRCTRG